MLYWYLYWNSLFYQIRNSSIYTIYKISSYKINFSKPNLVKCKGKDGGCEGADTDVTKHYCRDGICTRKYFDSEVI